MSTKRKSYNQDTENCRTIISLNTKKMNKLKKYQTCVCTIL